MSQTASTRRARREAERSGRKQRQSNGGNRSPWTSPMALLTFAALGVGVIILAVVVGSSGILSSKAAIATPGFPPPAAALVHGRTVGDPNAPVKIEVWADFQCPVCGEFSRQLQPLLLSAYVTQGIAQLTYRDLAFLGPESKDAAVGARIAEALKPGTFWAFHDLVFANQGKSENAGAFTRDRLADMAVSLGLDRQAFLAAYNDPQYLAAVSAETQQGAALGVTQTPTIFANGVEYVGLPAWSTLSAEIQQLASPSPAPGASSSPAASSPAASASPAL